MTMFLINMGTTGRRGLVQATELRVTLPKIFRKVNHGAFTELVDDGKVNLKQLDIAPRGEVFLADGEPSGWKSDKAHTARTAADLKKVLRRMRPEEADQVAAIDEELAIVRQRLQDLREQRTALLKDAWTRAHVVRLAEVEALIEQPQ